VTASIVIPTHERPVELARCLDGVAAMTAAGPDLEVVVVNDGGTPPAAQLLERLRGRVDLVVVEQGRRGPAAARNTGIARARGAFVAFLDDDCVPAPGWLATLAARFAADPDAAVGGRTVNALPDNAFSSASQLLVDHLYAHHNGDGGAPRFLASNNVAFPRRALLDVGGFDVAFPRPAGEDRELCDRWRRRGHRMTFAPEAIVHHAHVLGPATFWRQHFAYGRGAYAFRRVRAERDGIVIPFEPSRFYADLVRAPFRRSAGARAFALATLLVVAQLANAAGYAWERTRPVVHT
jgi:cellulose synthase/poly-beta-1,6-N-acetylglucosamine synthase-like glycosyltransferase